MSIFGKIFGGSNEAVVSKHRKLVERINSLEPEFEKKSQDELKALTAEWKSESDLDLDEILPQAFAAVREAAKRTIGQRHYDVQLIGGTVLHQGVIAEMKTGEGKTLVATLPAHLNALGGKGVHIVKDNDSLARRDAVWMGQIYARLGLSFGVINHETSYLYDPMHSELDKSRDEVAS